MRILSLMMAGVAVFGVGVASSVHAQPKLSFKCTFGPGAVGNWDAGSVKIDRGNFGNPTVVLHFDNVDPTAGTGRLIGNAGSSDLVVLTSGAGLNFIERTGSGNFVFTTIFRAKARGSNDFIAVMSRHMETPTGPFPSQYHGTCAAW
jgi:hypothetical protein